MPLVNARPPGGIEINEIKSIHLAFWRSHMVSPLPFRNNDEAVSVLQKKNARREWRINNEPTTPSISLSARLKSNQIGTTRGQKVSGKKGRRRQTRNSAPSPSPSSPKADFPIAGSPGSEQLGGKKDDYRSGNESDGPEAEGGSCKVNFAGSFALAQAVAEEIGGGCGGGAGVDSGGNGDKGQDGESVQEDEEEDEDEAASCVESTTMNVMSYAEGNLDSWTMDVVRFGARLTSPCMKGPFCHFGLATWFSPDIFVRGCVGLFPMIYLAFKKENLWHLL